LAQGVLAIVLDARRSARAFLKRAISAVWTMNDEADAAPRITRIIAGLLSLQLARLRLSNEELPPTAFDDFSVGYIYGFVDVMTQRVGICGDADAYKIFTILAKALFGHDMGEFVSSRMIGRQDLPDSVWGATAGRNDSRSWLRDPATPPVGWYNYCRRENPEIALRMQ
jgi:hypothetical protein